MPNSSAIISSKVSNEWRATTVPWPRIAPQGGVFQGQSCLISLAADRPVSEMIVKDDIAQHVAMRRGSFGGGSSGFSSGGFSGGGGGGGGGGAW